MDRLTAAYEGDPAAGGRGEQLTAAAGRAAASECRGRTHIVKHRRWGVRFRQSDR